MSGPAVEFLTPVGRLVQGNCFEGQTKDQQGNPYLIKNGPNKGQPMTKFFIAVAFAKNDPAWPAFHKLLEDTARRDFPTLFPNPASPCVNPNFAFKIIDGDGADQTGRLNSTKEGFAGHWVVRFSSQFPPKCFATGKYQPHEQLQLQNGVNPIPRGHYVRVAGTIRGNDDTMKPGLYVSHSMVEWARIGDVITSGPDAASVFGGTAGAAPAAGGLVPVPGAPHTIEQLRAAGWSDDQIVAAGHATRAAPAAVAPPPPAAVAPPPPAAVAPPPPAAVAPPPPVTPHTAILTAGPQMLPAAGATTYQQYIAAGWTDQALIGAGYMAQPAAPAPLAIAGSVAPPPPAATAAVAPPPPATGKVMLPAAGATTYAAYIQAGWNDAMLVQNGFMAP
jgi:hypothetical protein